MLLEFVESHAIFHFDHRDIFSLLICQSLFFFGLSKHILHIYFSIARNIKNIVCDTKCLLLMSCFDRWKIKLILLSVEPLWCSHLTVFLILCHLIFDTCNIKMTYRHDRHIFWVKNTIVSLEVASLVILLMSVCLHPIGSLTLLVLRGIAVIEDGCDLWRFA